MITFETIPGDRAASGHFRGRLPAGTMRPFGTRGKWLQGRNDPHGAVLLAVRFRPLWRALPMLIEQSARQPRTSIKVDRRRGLSGRDARA
jgi:hypothetical protein